MLVERGVVEQRFQAVLEVLGGAQVTDVARRYGVALKRVHRWLRRYAEAGVSGLVDESSEPHTYPHQMPARVEALVEMRWAHPGWGPRTIAYHLGGEGVSPVPSRSAIYRALLRHNLVNRKRRRKPRSAYKRWERSRAMELWQMDVMGGVRLADDSEANVVTGIDDHSRFCVSAMVVGDIEGVLRGADLKSEAERAPRLGSACVLDWVWDRLVEVQCSTSAQIAIANAHEPRGRTRGVTPDLDRCPDWTMMSHAQCRKGWRDVIRGPAEP